MSKKADKPNSSPDNKPAGDAPAADAADTAAGADTSAPDKTTKAEKTFSKADIEKAAKDAVEAAEKKWKDEQDLTELERANNELKTLRESNRLRDAKDEVIAALTKEGAKNADLLFDARKDKLAFSDDGKLTNLADLIKDLKDTFADQFGTDKPEGTIDGGAGTTRAGDVLTKEKLKTMSAADIALIPFDDLKKVLEG